MGPGEGVSSRLQLHRARCPEPVAAAAGVGAGEFAFFEEKKNFFLKGFWKTQPLNGLMVASSVVMVTGHPM